MVKYALITGAGTGIGRALSEQFHNRGYTVIGISPGFDIASLKDLESELGLIPIECDISDVSQIRNAQAKVKQITGDHLDVLYNNAGISIGGPAIDIDDDKLKKIFDVNVLGHMLMTKYFSQMVINARGTILFTSSVAGKVPLSWASTYCTTKAAIDHYALCLRGEMQPLGVKVHSVITGGVNTAIADSLSLPNLRKYFDTDESYASFQASSEMSRTKRSWAPSRYAKNVLRKALDYKNYGFNIYAGYDGYVLHLLRWLAPVWLMEWLVQRYFKQTQAFAVARKIRDSDDRA